jgi:putative NIF3 family GTP cyclohydrolase 1 type 2
MECIRHNIALVAAHTNLDSVIPGVSSWLAERIGLENVNVLQGRTNTLIKLVTYVPENDVERVKNASVEAGAGTLVIMTNAALCGKEPGHFEETSFPILS